MRAALISLLLLILHLHCIYTIPAPALAVSTCENSQTKIGESSYAILFGIFKFGDGGITAAMNSAKIDSVHHVDIQIREYFIVRRVHYFVVGASRE